MMPFTSPFDYEPTPPPPLIDQLKEFVLAKYSEPAEDEHERAERNANGMAYSLSLLQSAILCLDEKGLATFIRMLPAEIREETVLGEVA